MKTSSYVSENDVKMFSSKENHFIEMSLVNFYPFQRFITVYTH